MAVAYNVEIDQGADWFLNINYDQPNGDPVNLLGYSAALQLRSQPQDTEAVLTLTTDNDGIAITAAEGLVAIHATSEQTRAIDEGNYYYDLEITDDFTGIVTRLVQGIATVSAEVTRNG